MRTVVAAVGLVAVVGVAALATGTVSKSPPSLTSPSPDVTRSPGKVDLGVVIHDLLIADAAALEARFAGVTAREGLIGSGPIGLADAVSVPTREWTARLASARRALHAVVRDPKEPFEWWHQAPPGFARAAVFAGPRDFDIVLVVTAADGVPRPWRFSLANGRAVDVVIAAVASDGARSLVRLLGHLTPSPDAEPGRFLVLPPDEMRPPPPRIPPVGRAPPAPVRSPSLAPDGRTGDVAIDRLVDELLTADAARLLSIYRDMPARQERCDVGCEDVRIPPSSWTARFAAGSRSLYSVFTGDPNDAEIVVAVRPQYSAVEAWQFSTRAGRIVHVARHARPSVVGALPTHALVPGHPSLAREYERFYVLPPADELPTAPRGHALSTRTGRSGPDALLAVVETGDAGTLLAAFADPAAVPVRECQGSGSRRDAAYAAEWARTASTQIRGLHSVATLPAGYEPRADHMLIAYRQIKPYWWAALGILERGGEIVGLITGDGCSPEDMYPPAGYVVPPPAGGVAGLDPSRRSGIAIVDAILDAAAARDEAAMDRLIEYTPIACGDPTGFIPHTGPPPCPTGVARGTPVDILPEVVCAGIHLSRDGAPKEVIQRIGFDHPSGLYAVTRPPEGDLGVVIASSRGGSTVVTVGERGIKRLAAGCGPRHPDTFLRGTRPTFVLAPL
jgi:hypothetical protein